MKSLQKNLLIGLAAVFISASASAAKTPAQVCELGFIKVSGTWVKLVFKTYARGCVKGPDPVHVAKQQAKMDKKAINIGNKVASKSNNYADCDPGDNYADYFQAGAWLIAPEVAEGDTYCDGIATP